VDLPPLAVKIVLNDPFALMVHQETPTHTHMNIHKTFQEKKNVSRVLTMSILEIVN